MTDSASGGDQEITRDSVMLSFRAWNWPHKGKSLWKPLFEKWESMDPKMPLVTLGLDSPKSFLPLPFTDKEGLPEGYYELARQNLAKVEVSIRNSQQEDFRMLVVGGHYFAAEKLLDEAFMRSLQQELGTDFVYASTPRKGMLLVTAGIPSLDHFLLFREMTAAYFNQQEPRVPLAMTIYLVKDGVLDAVAAASAEGNPFPLNTEST